MTKPLRWIVCGALIAMALAPVPASAQYFGQNKVQYERFDFQVLKTPNFDIYYYPEERVAVERLARLAEQWRAQLSERLGFALSGRQPLVMYASQPHFVQTHVVDGIIGEGTGGVTEFLRRRMVMPFASTLSDTSHVLGHEMVHAFQFDIGGQGALALPLWFVEGMAEYLSLGPNDPHTAMWVRALSLEEELPGFEDLENPKYFPYRYGHAVWSYLAGRFGDRVVSQALIAAAESKDALAGIEAATGLDIKTLSEQWHAAIREMHAARPINPPVGRQVVSGESPRRGRLNISPSLSPDGKWLVYLSEQSQYSIDLYLAEAATGRVVRRLTSSATDTHLESLQFIASAGAWDSASAQFAFATVQSGKPVMTIVDVAGGKADRELALGSVDEAWHPTWSPDGRSIAFAGLEGGQGDLFVLDVAAGGVTQLTDDVYADLQPAWSPVGGQIAFVTDRYSSNLSTLSFGSLRPGLLTVATGAVTPLPAFNTGKHLNPQWNADGSGLLLVAAPDGVPNVYRLTLATREFVKLTDVFTGVSGITNLSPALSYAAQANQFAYGVFVDGGYDIRIAEATPVAAATPVAVGIPTAHATPESAEPQPASPVATQVEPYKSGLKLDFIGASTGAGIGSRGAFASGGVGLQFSDVLGDHTLGIVAQVNGGIRDFGAQVTYLNRKSRWNWGAVAMLSPYVTGAFNETVADLNGQLVIIDEEFLVRQTEVQAAGIALYPFSRALRFEVQGGGRRLWFGRELTTRIFSFDTGQLLDEQKEEFEAPSSLNLAEASGALVYDQTSFGPVGPIVGQRYRFEAGQTAGSLQFSTLNLDYRRYLVPFRPVTIAVRGLHVGRYGSDAEDTRLSPLFLGYPSLVRGYDVNSFESQECGAATAESSCPSFDRLLGTRLLVGNAELRFPLVGLFTGEYRYGPLPLEAFLFADAGVAWTADVSPKFSGGERTFVKSVGGGVRVNLLGYAVVEVAGVRALDRTNRKWRFALNLIPAF